MTSTDIVNMSARPLRLFIACIIWIALSACSSSGGYLPEPASLNAFEPQVQLVKNWSVSVGGNADVAEFTIQPVLLGNAVFAASGKDFRSFSPDTGQVNWQLEFDAPVTSGIGGWMNSYLWLPATVD